LSDVSEVLFSPDARSSDDTSSASLTTSEYVAIGVSSVLLGLIYVASIFLYLHIKKRRSQNEACPENPPKKGPKPKKNKDDVPKDRVGHISVDEDGVIKNNPLLGVGRHFSEEFDTDSGSCPTDADESIDNVQDSPKEIVIKIYIFTIRS
jgi:hypothetical protein